MSLFPAYAETSSATSAPDNYEWLTNPSFQNTDLEALEAEKLQVNAFVAEEPPRKTHKKKHRREPKSKSPPKEVIEFTGKENYYVDKKPSRSYANVSQLFKPACPNYRACSRVLGYQRKFQSRVAPRYFKRVPGQSKSKRRHRTNQAQTGFVTDADNTSETMDRVKHLNKTLSENANNTDAWIELIDLQASCNMKLSKTQLVDRKISIFDRALRDNMSNDRLLKYYIETISCSLPSFEVSKLIDQMLKKDISNYILWSAQIGASQNSMARCIVPDVLKIYEQAMRTMYTKARNDTVMLYLFTNCALFMRQSGLYEQFFALLKLGLELNVSGEKFGHIQPRECDQNTLIEYEEVVLGSGLPMNEIWLRIERLRQNFNFLPLPNTMTSSDPQRLVFTEDIAHFIYPFLDRDNAFSFVLIIASLLKVPLPFYEMCSSSFLRNEQLINFDAPEDVLAVFLAPGYFQSNDFDSALLDLIKGLSNGPSYLSTHIGHEIYFNVCTEILFLVADCFQIESKKKIIYQMWLRFERLHVAVTKCDGTISPEKSKKLKTKLKSFLKRDENRNVLSYYTEYALIEYELGNPDASAAIFQASLNESKEITARAEFWHGCVCYVETLLKRNQVDAANKCLTSLVLGMPIGGELELELTQSTILRALVRFSERQKDLEFIELKVDIMDVEQYFIADYFVSLIKANVYYAMLNKSKTEAMANIETLLRAFTAKSDRHRFVRENLYMLYVSVLDMPDRRYSSANSVQMDLLQRALADFPDNPVILRAIATCRGVNWPKIRGILIKTDSPRAILFLIAAAKIRFQWHVESCAQQSQFGLSTTSDTEANEITYKRRIHNLLKEITLPNGGRTRKNVLIWRLLLRSMFDMQFSLDEAKKVLYTALDECPWHKALYLDGTVYVPHELTQIQDLIIEKQLRMYALPEELEILRNG